MRPRRGFTLIELLIVIAIIAILSVVVLLVINPAELLRQSRDGDRTSDMATMADAVSIFVSDQSSASLGSSSIVYVSIPDPAATSTVGDQCQGLGLISLPASYSYHCAASSTFRKVDGTGWIPINFTKVSGGSPIGSLPIDPINTSSSRNYYTYTTNGSQYELTVALESQKYKLGGSNDIVEGDGGNLASVYEAGTGIGLEPLDYGDSSLVGYWNFNEGTGTVVYDYSGGNATGSWSGTQSGTNGYYSPGKIGKWAGSFDGSDNEVAINEALPTSALTVSLWLKLPATQPLINSGFMGSIASDFSIECGNSLPNNCVFFYYDGSSYHYPTEGVQITDTNWHLFTVTLDGNNAVTFYWDGSSTATYAMTAHVAGSGPFYIGHGWSNYGAAAIDDVRVYNRALSAAEVAAMYNGGK